MNRAGGAVSLIPVLEEVRDGAARTASELAIVRLTGEIDKLNLERAPFAKIVNTLPGAAVIGLACMVSGVAGVGWLLFGSSDCLAWPLLAIGLLGVC